jgi:SAM-dependent methyltransferase
VPIHTGSDFYDVEGFKAGGSSLRPFETEEMGPVDGKRLVHLQCHFGLDTLSWARQGASVVGVDFSQPASEAAQGLADELGLDARFVASDVYEAASALEGERFDIVYTGLGALNWLGDLGRWAGVVASLLAPGGLLYLAEFHPYAEVFGDDELTVERDYFQDVGGERFEGPAGTYADLEAKTVNNATHEWTHPISQVLTAVLDAGLRIETFHEHDYTLFQAWPMLERHADERGVGDVYRWPAGHPRLPLIYSLRARSSRP